MEMGRQYQKFGGEKGHSLLFGAGGRCSWRQRPVCRRLGRAQQFPGPI